jgi:LPXTG-site transpeptidase (sortase) family protein
MASTTKVLSSEPTIQPTFVPEPTSLPNPAQPGPKDEKVLAQVPEQVHNQDVLVQNPFIASLIGTEQSQLLAEADNTNPIIQGIQDSAQGSVDGASTPSTLPQTGVDDKTSTDDKLPSGNTLIENSSVVIPAIEVSSSLYEPIQVGSLLPVGDKEILYKNNILYGHNQMSVFGKISKLHYNDKIYITLNGRTMTYSAKTITKVDETDTAILNNQEPGVIFLLTCDLLNFHKRVVVRAELDR